MRRTYTPFVKRKISYDADGNMSQAYAVGDIDGDGDVDITDLNMLTSHLGDTCPGTSPGTTLTAGQFARADYNGDCVLTFTGDFTSLLGGYGSNQIGSYVGYSWDAENRLTRVEPLARDSSSGAIDASLRKVEFGYDYRGRRIEKRVYKRDSSNNANWGSNPIERRRFVWNGWLMLRETIETDSAGDGTFESSRTKTYAWGRDLAGDLESAGGIGGLLSIYDDNATTTGENPTADDLKYVYFYDANGNVGQLSNLAAASASASLVAKYEYDAYGNVSASTGTYSTANTHRFSTKPWDDETGLGYWGYRYYEPRMGRWLSRDPLGELVEPNNYNYLENDGIDYWDIIGLVKGSVIWTSCKQSCLGDRCVDRDDHAAIQRLFDSDAAFRKCAQDCFERRKKLAGGVVEPDLPKSGFEPGYNPKDWEGAVQWGSNCYAFAMCHKRPGSDRPQPGQKSGTWRPGPSQLDCRNIMNCVKKDAESQGKAISEVSCDTPCPNGTYKVMLVVGSSDYHWYVQNSDDCGTWSHKPGQSPCTDRDGTGCKIGDPRTAERGPLYPSVCGCLCVPSGGISVGN